MNPVSPDFKRLLEEAARFHGHLCGGQIIGVKMAQAGLREAGVMDPRGQDRKDLMVFVEIDRCATDAIMTVTGLTPGKRSLKILDLGKMAATFVNLKSHRAVRITARESSRAAAEQLAFQFRPHMSEQDAYNQALMVMSEEELMDIRQVRVKFGPGDLPGPPVSSVICEKCGETVLDAREVRVDGRVLCRTCATGAAYYKIVDEIQGRGV
ncbi:MAG: FmdE family protein [Pseudomonadota bacterium]